MKELMVPEGSSASFRPDRLHAGPARPRAAEIRMQNTPWREGPAVVTEDGTVLRILHQMIRLPPQRRSPSYNKLRWAIELFFRWVKQNLRSLASRGLRECRWRIQIAVRAHRFLTDASGSRRHTKPSKPRCLRQARRAISCTDGASIDSPHWPPPLDLNQMANPMGL